MYLKIENGILCSVDTIGENKSSKYVFGNTIFKNYFYETFKLYI